MSKPKGPPCGFLGLGSSSGASGNDCTGRQIDLALRGNVDRREGAHETRDVSMTDADGIPVVNDSGEGNSKRPYNRRAKLLVRRGWSMETWSQIKRDIPSPEPFAFMFPKKAKKTVVRQTPLSVDSTLYTRSELLEILGMFPEAPPSAYKIKSAYESRMDLDSSKYKIEKDPARHTKGGPSAVIDENYLYSFFPPKKLGGPHRKERFETLKELNKLLDRIAQANLENANLATMNRKLDEEAAVQKLRYEQTIRSADGFSELTYLIKSWYDRAYDKIVRDWKHNGNEDYYHPKDRLAKEGQEESVRKQLSTFTEVNVNSWAMDDYRDPTIVYSNKGLRILANDDPDLPFDERKELEFPGAAPRADQPGFADLEEVRLSMARGDNISEKSNRDWEAYLISQIVALGEEYLEGGEIAVAFDNRVSKLLFKLKEDPLERTNTLFRNNRVQKIKRKEFSHVLRTIKAHLAKERDILGSSYCRYLDLKQDLALRELRFEIIDKIKDDKWYFVLQHIPPIELKPRTTHCAHPYCVYHESDVMPAGAYRLVFMSVEHNCDDECRFDEISDNTGTPGRTEDGQMLFCLTCVENLFNGVGLIEVRDKSTAEDVSQRKETLWRLPNGQIDEEWNSRLKKSAEAAWLTKTQRKESAEGFDDFESVTNISDAATLKAPISSSASGRRSGGFEKAAHPQPPSIKPMLMAPGLDVFAATLHTFIRPEIRYTWHEFYTLNSYEFHAFMKWKNMCIRKTMWEIPVNRAFNLQLPGETADYDLVNFFGDDNLDISEPRPSIVIGIALNVEEVDADDISTWQVEKSYGADAVEDVGGDKNRVPHPLSQVMNVGDINTTEPEYPLGESIVEKLNSGRTRVMHPLSRIMALVDERVQDAWAAMDPPYVPRRSIRAPDPSKRKWPPHYFWKSHFEKELEEQKVIHLQKVIDLNYGTINRRLKALGLDDLIRARQQMVQAPVSSYETNTGDMNPASIINNASVVTPPTQKNQKKGEGVCTTCGTTKSPEWRNGPKGHNSLCNACGLRWWKEARKNAGSP